MRLLLELSISNAQLSQLSDLIVAKMGLYFPEVRWHDLERGLVSAAATFGFPNVSAYYKSLISAPMTRNQIEDLSIHLTIGETYFFREKPTFDALRKHILPELIRARSASSKQLRIWCAGCCTGEEAYSSAILLNQLIPNLDEWMLTILGTDINKLFLSKAVEGVYGEWSFRGIPPNIKNRYFTKTATEHFEILPSIKQLVKFSFLNLVDDIYPSPRNNTHAMDVIFCRNVLMYFSPEQAKKVVRNLYLSLVEGGWLIASLGEASHLLFADFETVYFPDAIVYQKRSETEAPKPTLDILLEKSQREKTTPSRPRTRVYQDKLSPPRVKADTVADTIISTVAEPLPSSPQEAKWQEAKSPALYAQGLYAEAEAQVHVELAAKPEDSAALILLARLCANQGRLDEAAEWCKRCINADRLNLRGYYLYATIQMERGEIEAAIKLLNQALYLDPEFVLAHFALGNLGRQQGKKREANKHFAYTLRLLKNYRQDEILPESDGWTAGRLIEMISSTSFSEELR